jgi:hypothetical protein
VWGASSGSVSAEGAIGCHVETGAADALQTRADISAEGAHQLARILLVRHRDVGERQVAARARRQGEPQIEREPARRRLRRRVRARDVAQSASAKTCPPKRRSQAAGAVA